MQHEAAQITEVNPSGVTAPVVLICTVRDRGCLLPRLEREADLIKEAIAQYEAALRTQPDELNTLMKLSWILSTSFFSIPKIPARIGVSISSGLRYPEGVGGVPGGSNQMFRSKP